MQGALLKSQKPLAQAREDIGSKRSTLARKCPQHNGPTVTPHDEKFFITDRFHQAGGWRKGAVLQRKVLFRQQVAHKGRTACIPTQGGKNTNVARAWESRREYPGTAEDERNQCQAERKAIECDCRGNCDKSARPKSGHDSCQARNKEAGVQPIEGGEAARRGETVPRVDKQHQASKTSKHRMRGDDTFWCFLCLCVCVAVVSDRVPERIYPHMQPDNRCTTGFQASFYALVFDDILKKFMLPKK